MYPVGTVVKVHGARRERYGAVTWSGKVGFIVRLYDGEGSIFFTTYTDRRGDCFSAGLYFCSVVTK